MAKKIDESALLFDKDDVKAATVQQPQSLLPRLFRVIFYGEEITNNIYLERYNRFLERTQRHRPQSEFSYVTTSNRKAFNNPSKMTFRLLHTVINAMGYDIEAVSIRLKDKISGTVHTYSTDDTADDLDAYIAERKDISLDSF